MWFCMVLQFASSHPLPQCLFSCIQGAGLAEAGSLSDEYVNHWKSKALKKKHQWTVPMSSEMLREIVPAAVTCIETNACCNFVHWDSPIIITAYTAKELENVFRKYIMSKKIQSCGQKTHQANDDKVQDWSMLWAKHQRRIQGCYWGQRCPINLQSEHGSRKN